MCALELSIWLPVNGVHVLGSIHATHMNKYRFLEMESSVDSRKLAKPIIWLDLKLVLKECTYNAAPLFPG